MKLSITNSKNCGKYLLKDFVRTENVKQYLKAVIDYLQDPDTPPYPVEWCPVDLWIKVLMDNDEISLWPIRSMTIDKKDADFANIVLSALPNEAISFGRDEVEVAGDGYEKSLLIRVTRDHNI